MSDEQQEYEIEVVDETTPNAQQGAEDRSGDEQGGSDNQQQQRRPSRLRQRVDELTRKWRSEEREKEQFRRAAEQHEQQYTQLQQQFNQVQQESTKAVYSTLSDNKRLLEAHMKVARDRGDHKTADELQNKLIDVSTRMSRIEEVMPQVGQQGSDTIQHQHQPQVQPQQQQAPKPEQGQQQQQAQQPLPEAAQDWAEANAWFREHKDLHPIINGHDAALRAKGMDPRSPEFYQKLNERLKQDLPEDLAGKLRVSLNDDLGDDDDDEPPVAAQQQQSKGEGGMPSSGRASPSVPKGKQKVKLTREQVDFCRRNNIDLQEYAKQLSKTGDNSGYNPIL